jgi:RNA polymerase sigma-70 factor (ECF subfamily)
MNDTPTTRHSLLVRLRDPRDEPAWAEFVSIYEPLVYSLARRRGLQDADARDLCQDVFRAVAGAIGNWDPDPGRGSFRAWLFRVARNLTINWLTASKRHPSGTGDSDWHEMLREIPAPVEETAAFDAEYRRRVFQWAADAIEPEFEVSTWQAFWRTAVLERQPRAVASDLGISVGAVYIARSRVLARLRNKIRQSTEE